jgi:hypothetical protein
LYKGETGQATPDWSTPGGVWKVGKDEDMGQLRTQIFTPDMSQAMQITDTVLEQSTMYRQVSGQQMGSGTPYSTVALLSQAGRQALVPYQRMAGHAIAEAMQAAFILLKEDGGQLKFTADASLNISANEIADDMLLTADLTLALPQDDRMNVQLAQWATQGPSPLMSRAGAREKFLGIGQSSDVEKEILAERVFDMKSQMRLQELEQQAQMQAQQAMGAQMPQGQPQLPQGAPQQGPSPDQLAQMQQQMAMQEQAGPGMPMAAPQAAPGEMPAGEMGMMA